MDAHWGKAAGEVVRKFSFSQRLKILDLSPLQDKTFREKLLHRYVTTYSLVFHSTISGRLVEVSVDCFYWLGNGDLIKQ